MYLIKNSKEPYWGLDLESNGLLNDATTIWCVCVKHLESGEEQTFLDKETFNKWYQETQPILIGHNAGSFDGPLLNRLWSSGVDLLRISDTLTLSYLYSPGLPLPNGYTGESGPHSLDAWGYRLKFPKTKFDKFSEFSQEMVEYCLNDVRLTLKLYQALTEKMIRLGYSELSASIEHKIRLIIDQQEANGCYFDVSKAEKLKAELETKKAELSKEIKELFPPRLEPVAEYKARKRKDGTPFAQFEKHQKKYPRIDLYEEAGESWYRCYDWKEFNLGSPKQRIERLLELGWEPQEFTKKGSPKVDEDALMKFAEVSGKPQIKALADWLVVHGRLTMLAGNPETGSKGWLGNVRDHGNGDTRIHGRVLSCGATTRRMRHLEPNTANIPSGAKAKYGEECRSLWGVKPSENLALVGYDAAGLETAGLCHYLGRQDATELLLRPKPNDIHTTNATALSKVLGREIDREWGAKTSWYAWLYGAYPPKLGQIVKGPPSDGEKIVDTFFRNVPGLKKLIEEVQYEFRHNNGLLETVDGGFVRCPSLGAALNYKIQSLGAIVMKMTSILIDEEAGRQRLWFRKVLDIHDEGQLETRASDADNLGRLCVASITDAGTRLGVRVKLTGDYKTGEDWSMTH